jgi:Ser-tRNA(Ala) deacylase AlaX
VKEFEAEVVDIREEFRSGVRQRWQMMLDRTSFSAASSTGTLEAIARSGTLLQIPVLGVVEDGDDVWHVVEKPLAAGTNVTGRVAEPGTKGG